MYAEETILWVPLRSPTEDRIVIPFDRDATMTYALLLKRERVGRKDLVWCEQDYGNREMVWFENHTAVDPRLVIYAIFRYRWSYTPHGRSR